MNNSKWIKLKSGGVFILKIAVYFLIINWAIVSILIPNLVFPAPSIPYGKDLPIKKIPLEDGKNLAALFIENPLASYTILFFHGNGENLQTAFLFINLLHEWGFKVSAYDYRGYGQSSGPKNLSKAWGDPERFYNWTLQQKGVDKEKLIIWGYSLGGAFGVDLATKIQPSGLILISTMATAIYSKIPYNPFLWDELDNLSKISLYKGPLFLFHGSEDWIIGPWNSRYLYEKSGSGTHYYESKGAGHGSILFRAEEFKQKFSSYLKTIDPDLIDNNSPNCLPLFKKETEPINLQLKRLELKY